MRWPLAAGHLVRPFYHVAPGRRAAAALRGHTDYQRAAPTPDHFIPLLHLAGLASAAKQTARTLIDGYALGSLSFTLEAKCPIDSGDRRPGASLPDPRDVPAEDTNA